jgi:hypothetical protein
VSLVSFHTVILFASRVSSSICTNIVVSSRVPSLISSLLKREFGKKKTVQSLVSQCDRGRAQIPQDIAEQSLRDVFNDVSKYIRNISISLNAVFP